MRENWHCSSFISLSTDAIANLSMFNSSYLFLTCKWFKKYFDIKKSPHRNNWQNFYFLSEIADKCNVMVHLEQFDEIAFQVDSFHHQKKEKTITLNLYNFWGWQSCSLLLGWQPSCICVPLHEKTRFPQATKKEYLCNSIHAKSLQ